MLLLIAALGSLAFFLRKDMDRVRPEITFTGETISYIEGEDESVLLSNVQAYDDRDGDLTSEIRVNQILPIEQKTRARVTYVVLDSQNNIGTASQIVDYTPVLAVEEESVSDESVSETEEGEEDSEADPAAPVLVLSTNSDTIKPSDSFNYMAYSASVTDDEDSEETLYRNIVIEGDYSSRGVGTFPLTIYVTDSDGNASNKESFILNRG